MAAVIQLDAKIPVKTFAGPDFGAYAIQQALNSRGYSAQVTPLQAAKQLSVRLKRITSRKPDGNPIFGTFDDGTAKADISASAAGFFTTLAAGKEWIVATVAAAKDFSPSEIGKTAGEGTRAFFDSKKAEYDACIARGGSALTCAGGSVGIPKWMWWAAGGLAGLYVLNSLTQAKRAFLGGAPKEAYVPQTYGRVRVRKTSTGHYYSLDGGQSWHGPYATKPKAFSAGRNESYRINR